MSKYLFILGLLWSGLATAQTLPAEVSGCSEADYVVADLESSVAVQGFSYTPRCLKVVVGSQVTIAASGHHPLAPQAQGNNPIMETENTQTYEFNEPGVFGYFCTRHGDEDGTGMAGSIWVVEGL